MSTPLARATTGLESSARSGAAAAHNSAVMVSAQETMRRVEAMKRNPLAKGANRRVIFKRSDLGANRSGLVVLSRWGLSLRRKFRRGHSRKTPVLGNGRIAAPPNERVKMVFALTTNPPPPISRQNLGLHAALHKPK